MAQFSSMAVGSSLSDRAMRSSGQDAAQLIDASGRTIVPGFIDLQINGAFGSDFTDDPSSIWCVAEKLPRFGVTAFLPTIITSPLDTIARAQAVVTAAAPAGLKGARPLGLHVEGPYLNPARKGAHNPAYLRLPSLEAIAEWSPSAGIRLVTLAPELPGALPVIGALAARGVLVSTGHSNGTYADAMAAFDAGARYGTHLFNAMSALGHREPGLPGALLTDRRPIVGLIADGVHTHESIVALAWQMLGPARLNLVSDAMAALGMPPGRHRLADADVIVDGNSARLADGTLAGSILSPDQALRNFIRFTGCAFDDAVRTVTATPARALGIHLERGRIAAGALADLAVLSPDLEVLQTVVEGTLVFDVVS